MKLTFEGDVAGAIAAADRFVADLDDEFEAVFVRHGERVAETAQRTHEFQNQSGDLERETQAIPPVGRLSEGTLRGGAVAGMPYGEYVEAKMPFLAPAAELSEPFLEEDGAAALERAAQSSGLK
jgi:hypothetical protein